MGRAGFSLLEVLFAMVLLTVVSVLALELTQRITGESQLLAQRLHQEGDVRFCQEYMGRVLAQARLSPQRAAGESGHRFLGQPETLHCLTALSHLQPDDPAQTGDTFVSDLQEVTFTITTDLDEAGNPRELQIHHYEDGLSVKPLRSLRLFIVNPKRDHAESAPPKWNPLDPQWWPDASFGSDPATQAQTRTLLRGILPPGPLSPASQQGYTDIFTYLDSSGQVIPPPVSADEHPSLLVVSFRYASQEIIDGGVLPASALRDYQFFLPLPPAFVP